MSENSLLTNLQPRETHDKNKKGGVAFAIFGTVWLLLSWFVSVSFLVPAFAWLLQLVGIPVRQELITGNIVMQALIGFSYAPFTLALAYPFYRRYLPVLQEKFWRFIGYTRSLKLKDVGGALVGYAVYFILSALILLVVQAAFHGLDLNQKQALGISVPSTSFDLITTFIVLVIVPPLVEETLFRGVLFSTIRRGYAVPITAVVTSLVFGAAHLNEAAGGALNVGLFLDTFSLSLVLCYLRIRTGALWSGMLLHGLKNFVAFLYFAGYIR